ncbi:hypothetical protein QYM36_014156 [Artemia franciscana]|uniref:Uncharacterized protein n=1 Tax=Artemia franciscana TaxID=6661 RepID=A0AA88HMS6_ARTSF|nr:hypothetical protein QYM36_014156 [Artemia franciscana]
MLNTKSLVFGIPVSFAGISVWWIIKKHREFKTNECSRKDREGHNSYFSKKSEPKQFNEAKDVTSSVPMEQDIKISNSTLIYKSRDDIGSSTNCESMSSAAKETFENNERCDTSKEKETSLQEALDEWEREAIYHPSIKNSVGTSKEFTETKIIANCIEASAHVSKSFNTLKAFTQYKIAKVIYHVRKTVFPELHEHLEAI